MPIIVGVFMQLFVPSLWIELVLHPILILLAAMSVVAATKDELAQSKKVIDTLLVMAVLVLAGYQVVTIISDWPHLDKTQILRQFAMPVWLSIGVLPFIYLLGVYAAYEGAFARLAFGHDEAPCCRIAKRLALLASFHVRPHEFVDFMKQSQWQVSSANSFAEVRRLVRESRREHGKEAS